MIQPMIVIPSVILIFIQSFGALVIFRVGQEKKILEIKILGVSFFFLMSLTFTSLFFELIKSPNNISLATNLQLLATLFTVVAIVGFWATIFYLNGSHFKRRFIGLGFLLPFSSGMIMHSLKMDLTTTNDWTVLYDPVWGILLFGITVNWILFEIAIVYWQGYQKRQEDSFYSLLIFLSQIIAILSAIIAIIEQTVMSGQTRYYFILNALGAVLFTYSVKKSPTSIISPDFNLSFMVVSHKDSGVLIHSHTFTSFEIDKDKESIDDASRYHLFSSAINGILQLIGELTYQNRTTRTFSFNNMEIMVEEGSEVMVILVSTREYKFIRDLLKSFTREITRNYNFGSIVNFDLNFHNEVNTLIEQTFGQFDPRGPVSQNDALIVTDK